MNSLSPPTQSDSRRPALTRNVRVAPALLLALITGCGFRPGSAGDIDVQGGRLVAEVKAPLDTVFTSTSQILAQERIALRRYEPENGVAETGFIDIAAYPAFFDRELWDDTERLIKLRFLASSKDSTTVLVCEPYYNPYEVITDEADFTQLRLVPQGHPGFDVAAALTRRIAAHAEKRAVTAP